MKTNSNSRIRYKSDAAIQQIRTNVFVIISYIFTIWLWQFTLSFQSSMYTLMNVAVVAMWAFGGIGCLVCKEDRETIVRNTKSKIITYLVTVFVYDLFLRAVIVDKQASAVAGFATDPSLSVAQQFLTVVSTMIKIGFPIAFIVWMLQKFAVFKNGISKQKQIEVLRNIRKTTVDKKKDKSYDPDKDNINNQF